MSEGGNFLHFNNGEVIDNIAYITPTFDHVFIGEVENANNFVRYHKLCIQQISEFNNIMILNFRHLNQNDDLQDVKTENKHLSMPDI